MITPDDKEHDKLLCERLATTVDHGICKCAERHRIAELEAALQAGRDLMAIVHRDGGDYRQKHGDRKAADVAIAIVSKLRVDLDAERERREAAENLLLSYESQDLRAIAKHFARYEKLCASSSRALAD